MRCSPVDFAALNAPVFLKLTGAASCSSAAGPVAAGKLDGLLGGGRGVTVVAPEIRPEIERPGVTLVRRAFEPTRDLDGAWWVVAAAPPEVNRQVLRGRGARGASS